MNPQLTRDWDLLIPLALAGGIGWVVAAVVDRDYVEIFKDPSKLKLIMELNNEWRMN